MKILSGKRNNPLSGSHDKAAPYSSGDGPSKLKVKVYESYKIGFFIGQGLYEQEIQKK